MTTSKKKNRQTAAICRLLDQFIRVEGITYPDPRKNRVLYKEGWTDEKIAIAANNNLAEEDRGCTAQHVASFRRQIYGNLLQGKGSDTNIELKKYILALEIKLQELREEFEELKNEVKEMKEEKTILDVFNFANQPEERTEEEIEHE